MNSGGSLRFKQALTKRFNRLHKQIKIYIDMQGPSGSNHIQNIIRYAKYSVRIVPAGQDIIVNGSNIIFSKIERKRPTEPLL
jgi:hypothetical protein